MTDEPNTPASGPDNVTLSEDDTSEEFDYLDPDEEEQDTEEAEDTEETDDGADEDGGEEAEVQEAVDEDPEFEIEDGVKARRSEIKEWQKGALRQADYTRKMQETSQARKANAETAKRIESITSAFVDHLASLVPDEPDFALAARNPTEYARKKAMYDASMAQVQKLVEVGSKAKEVTGAMSSEDAEATIADENRKLAEAVPATTTKAGREQFFKDVQGAAEQIGFTTQELQSISDHRLFVLAHWAMKGMKGDKAKTAAKAKVEKAPPVAPRKPGQAASNANRNVSAMRKLAKTGSLRDALRVDFE
jgi:hypothetical protein